MAGSNVPILESVRAAFGFWKFGTPRAVGVLSLVMLANMVSASMGRSLGAVVMGVAVVLIGIAANGTLLRLAFADEHGGDQDFRIGPLGLQWGMPESRLLAANLLLFLLFFIAVLFLMVLAVICGAAGVLVSGAPAVATAPGAAPSSSVTLAVGLLALALGLAGVWVGVRVCLFPAATIAEKRVMVFSTWRLTKGQFWPIFAALFIVFLPAVVLTAIRLTPNLPDALQQMVGMLLCVVHAFIELPLVCGLYAYLYRGLRPPFAEQPAAFQTAVSAGPWS